MYEKANRKSGSLSGTVEVSEATGRLVNHLSLFPNGRGSCHQRSAKCYQNKGPYRLESTCLRQEGGHTQVESYTTWHLVWHHRAEPCCSLLSARKYQVTISPPALHRCVLKASFEVSLYPTTPTAVTQPV